MKTIVARLITDKPVKKTAYQVKGVFMKQYPNSPAIPMLDGRYRNKFLYPRVQVKILNEQIYIVGIKDGADPVLTMTKELELLNFGNITFNIIDVDIKENIDQFIDFCRSGPDHAEVSDLDIKEGESKNFQNFKIEY